MAELASKEIQNQWKANILEQRSSGLSMAAWCRQNGHAVHSFYYWQDKLFPKDPINRSSFSEIASQGSATGLILKYQEFNIQLGRDFDSATLRTCSKSL